MTLALIWFGLIPIPTTPDERLAYERKRIHTLEKQHSETDNPFDLINFHFLGRYEMGYAREIRGDVVRARPGLGEVLAMWDDEQDERRFAMYAKKMESLYVSAGVERPIPNDVDAM
ncbi:uncharacterized protein EDB91DRAFT_1259370 [Suillus paluster]|uniref:uncharacterized protein n=1 Tax=Suillus paluster TaxID=48578 RepID=UPI001B8723AE|nr:uncharacterized protein EDB91DRAFT_1259370 [Suillus paluster]KAG1717729.1 hypothetical protein EDB91DRAFT_1259370 [Suillus paluster]